MTHRHFLKLVVYQSEVGNISIQVDAQVTFAEILIWKVEKETDKKSVKELQSQSVDALSSNK